MFAVIKGRSANSRRDRAARRAERLRGPRDSATTPICSRPAASCSRGSGQDAHRRSRTSGTPISVAETGTAGVACASARPTFSAIRDLLPITAGGHHLLLVRDGARILAAERACPHEGADLALGRCVGWPAALPQPSRPPSTSGTDPSRRAGPSARCACSRSSPAPDGLWLRTGSDLLAPNTARSGCTAGRARESGRKRDRTVERPRAADRSGSRAARSGSRRSPRVSRGRSCCTRSCSGGGASRGRSRGRPPAGTRADRPSEGVGPGQPRHVVQARSRRGFLAGRSAALAGRGADPPLDQGTPSRRMSDPTRSSRRFVYDGDEPWNPLKPTSEGRSRAVRRTASHRRVGRTGSRARAPSIRSRPRGLLLHPGRVRLNVPNISLADRDSFVDQSTWTGSMTRDGACAVALNRIRHGAGSNPHHR
jgi:3-phenylpropionate/trans-cinnamate dioxygenase ferredoxin subunit